VLHFKISIILLSALRSFMSIDNIDLFWSEASYATIILSLYLVGIVCSKNVLVQYLTNGTNLVLTCFLPPLSNILFLVKIKKQNSA
jgi:hypothetical protein